MNVRLNYFTSSEHHRVNTTPTFRTMHETLSWKSGNISLEKK